MTDSEDKNIINWKTGTTNELPLEIGVKLSTERRVLVKLENNKMLVEFYTIDRNKFTNTITLTKQPAIYLSTYKESEIEREGGNKLILRITGTSNKFLKRGKAYKRDIEFIQGQYMETALEAMKEKAKEIGLKEDLIDERGLKNDYGDGEYLYRDSQPISKLVVVDTMRNEVVPLKGGSKRRTKKHGRKHKKRTHKKRYRKHRTRRQKRRTGRKLEKKLKR